MIETKVPKDIRSYKTKLIGPLTLRQLLCVVVAAIVDGLLYAIISTLGVEVDITIIIYAVIFLDIPIFAFIAEPEGMPMEKYLTEILYKQFTSKKNRTAENRLSVKEKQKTPKEIKELEKKQSSIQRKHPELKAYK